MVFQQFFPGSDTCIYYPSPKQTPSDESSECDTQDNTQGSTISDTVIQKGQYTIDSESDGFESSEQEENEPSTQPTPPIKATTKVEESQVAAPLSQSPVTMATPPKTPPATVQQTPSPKSGEENQGFFRQMSDHGTPLANLKLSIIPGRPLSPRPRTPTPDRVVPTASPTNAVTSPTTKSPLAAGTVDLLKTCGTTQITTHQRSSGPVSMAPSVVSTTVSEITHSQPSSADAMLLQRVTQPPVIVSASSQSRIMDCWSLNSTSIGGSTNPVYNPPPSGKYQSFTTVSQASFHPVGTSSSSAVALPKIRPIFPSDMCPLNRVPGYSSSSTFAQNLPTQYPPIVTPLPIRPDVPGGTNDGHLNMDELSKALSQDLGKPVEKSKPYEPGGFSTSPYPSKSPVPGRPQTPGSSHSSKNSSCTNSPFLERRVSGGNPSPSGQKRNLPGPPHRSISSPVVVKKTSFDESIGLTERRHNSGTIFQE